MGRVAIFFAEWRRPGVLREDAWEGIQGIQVKSPRNTCLEILYRLMALRNHRVILFDGALNKVLCVGKDRVEHCRARLHSVDRHGAMLNELVDCLIEYR